MAKHLNVRITSDGKEKNHKLSFQVKGKKFISHGAEYPFVMLGFLEATFYSEDTQTFFALTYKDNGKKVWLYLSKDEYPFGALKVFKGKKSVFKNLSPISVAQSALDWIKYTKGDNWDIFSPEKKILWQLGILSKMHLSIFFKNACTEVEGGFFSAHITYQFEDKSILVLTGNGPKIGKVVKEDKPQEMITDKFDLEGFKPENVAN